jgi:N6-adenosine-specific RNA methylase IME4
MSRQIALLHKFTAQVSRLRCQIPQVRSVEEAMKLIAMADSIEKAMNEAGYRKNTQAIRPINEARFHARWKLGNLLAKIERSKGGRPAKNSSGVPTGFRAYLRDIGISKDSANECERIGAIPETKLAKAFQDTEREGVLNTIESMFAFARPFWKIKRRSQRHRKIKDAAAEAQQPDKFGPFPLIYADPPTPFETFSESGGGRSPAQHYPTLSWEEIEDFKIYGKRVENIAHANAMLFLWSTSSNLDRALRVMQAWGFEFKTSAMWDKGKQGTGLIFRNMHEVLLYGDRGKVPGPVYVPPSVFRYPRGAHSAKPPEIRQEIERMYPDYNADTRLELFSRSDAPGWTHFGFEAKQQAQAAE